MKIIILSSDTPHHRFFINKLSQKFNIVHVFFETKKLKKNYPIGPFLENEHIEFEKMFFENISSEINSNLITVCNNINNKINIEIINKFSPDIAISFGTGLIKPHIFNLPKHGTINIHRGYIHEYRGLDSYLWAILNNEINKIYVTIHCVDDDLDTGKIIAEKPVDLTNINNVYEIRYWSTLLVTDMMIDVLNSYKNNTVSFTIQNNKGKYYTAMHIDKKKTIIDLFKKYKNSWFLKNKTPIIAEIGMNHEGDFEYCKNILNLALQTDVDIIKFQTYNTSGYINEKYSKHRYDHFEKFFLSNDKFEELAKICKKHNKIFMTSFLG